MSAFALLAATLVQPAHAQFCPDPDLVADVTSVVEDVDGSIVVKVEVHNEGKTCSDSFTVQLFSTKSGYWAHCSLHIDTIGIDAIPAGGSRQFALSAPRGFYDPNADSSLALVVDPENSIDEDSEKNNTVLVGVKDAPWPGGQVTWAITSMPLEQCVLSEVDPIFTAVNAGDKLWVKAEIL